MSSVFNSPNPKPNLGLNGFDLSQRRIFSCSPGQLLPCWKDFATAGDKYKINSSTFIRTEAIETSAFIRLKHYFDVFFVPITQIYSFWNEFFYGVNDVMQDWVPSSTSRNFGLPTMPIYSKLYPGSVSSPDSFWVVTPTSSSTEVNHYFTVDEFGIPKLWNAFRLLDMLEYGAISRTELFQRSGSILSSYTNEAWFPGFLLAYHKIFHSHYLNTKYFKNNPLLYNVDSCYGSVIPSERIQPILSTIHYRPYPIDYFTSIQPSPTFNDSFANSVAISSTKPSDSIYTSYNSYINSDSVSPNSLSSSVNNPSFSNIYNGISTVNKVGTLNLTNLSAGGSAPSVGDLRAMFALDRLARVTASTGSHYADQILAHLGVKIPEGIKDEAYFLGSQVTDIIINEVVATATTNADGIGNTIGDIAGKGFTGQTQGKPITFTVPCDGIMMCISSIVPIPDYASARPDIVNRYLNPFDFWRPETDNLGMSPFWDSAAWFNNIGVNSSVPSPIGWQPRHMELKTKYDLVHESMFATHRDVWVGYKQNLYNSDSLQLADDPSISPELSKNVLFYVAPQYCNNIFQAKVPSYLAPANAGFAGSVLPFTGHTAGGDDHWDPNLEPEVIYSSDNFTVNMDIKAFKVSRMSVHSLPKFI